MRWLRVRVQLMALANVAPLLAMLGLITLLAGCAEDSSRPGSGEDMGTTRPECPETHSYGLGKVGIADLYPEYSATLNGRGGGPTVAIAFPTVPGADLAPGQRIRVEFPNKKRSEAQVESEPVIDDGGQEPGPRHEILVRLEDPTVLEGPIIPMEGGPVIFPSRDEVPVTIRPAEPPARSVLVVPPAALRSREDGAYTVTRAVIRLCSPAAGEWCCQWPGVASRDRLHPWVVEPGLDLVVVRGADAGTVVEVENASLKPGDEIIIWRE